MNDYSYRERDYPFGRAVLGLNSKMGLQTGLGALVMLWRVSSN
jgi:hypothetical protein